MGRFDGVLLASDFDNTLIYTEDALLRGEPIPAPAGAEPAGADVFHGGGRPVRHLHRPGPGGL